MQTAGDVCEPHLPMVPKRGGVIPRKIRDMIMLGAPKREKKQKINAYMAYPKLKHNPHTGQFKNVWGKVAQATSSMPVSTQKKGDGVRNPSITSPSTQEGAAKRVLLPKENYKVVGPSLM